ncbi:hypothetical protein [Isoptericola aurantiacus]|uniref:hypothetical protein n=1 Tax=Isoptericola aurantiacus TaxID=3377839 RepID=UPI00383A2D68
MTTLDGFELRLPPRWVVVPDDVGDGAGWARGAASALLDDDPATASEPALRADTLDVLAEQLAAVAESVRGTGIAALTAAALVDEPSRGVVDAMVTLVGQEDLGRGEFEASLAALVEGSAPGQVVHAGTVDAVADAGDLAGLHLVLADVDDEVDGVAALEERVVLGVFPPGCRDMVEVTAVARSVGTFADMPQAVVDLLAGLSVDVGGAA